ncbi:TetR/AcrR family transcriptional regulator [Mycobacterium sp. CVI_P3]|uniref:TetR/AcrR family transcriptional regulator n=1 Tax=Mycobacterium pinniadriaticum TaxID=2994102 RepID=A0ABT3SCW9_9MYCO|nr:TetR/AcrR family transcriptional regulator [Mycobacterium pinniadriaticum]MCX2930932.1 TetR/AcrR family transcriptional regulator [Mycobacterium pinniadriaticum]MCX2937356.1 TetR/AcrR family transcriptional regulator [Mycobacterium pinniadriaticum]
MSARQRLIDTTIELVRRHGVGSTSVSQILEHSGLARRTLYLNFPDGKPELIAAATESAAASFTSMLEEMVADGDPIATVDAFVRAWEAVLGDSDYLAGCPMVAVTLGGSEAPAAAAVAANAFAQWVGLMASRFERAGLDPAAAQDLATTVVAAIEGAVIMSVAARSPIPLQRAGRDLAVLVGARLAGG